MEQAIRVFRQLLRVSGTNEDQRERERKSVARQPLTPRSRGQSSLQGQLSDILPPWPRRFFWSGAFEAGGTRSSLVKSFSYAACKIRTKAVLQNECPAGADFSKSPGRARQIKFGRKALAVLNKDSISGKVRMYERATRPTRPHTVDELTAWKWKQFNYKRRYGNRKPKPSILTRHIDACPRRTGMEGIQAGSTREIGQGNGHRRRPLGQGAGPRDRG